MKNLIKLVVSIESFLHKKHFKNQQGAIDSRITIALSTWIRSGGYTRSDLNMDDVAVELGVDKSQLKFYFQNVMGVPFSVWKKKLRIEDAKKMMADNPEMPISAVGAAVGYPDKSNFKKRFFEVESCTPSEWKSFRNRE